MHNQLKTEYSQSNYSLCKECNIVIKKESVKIGKKFQVKNLIILDNRNEAKFSVFFYLEWERWGDLVVSQWLLL